jgi:hypothetical protein
MAIDQTDIWHLFNIAWEKYARPTQELCLDLVGGQVDAKQLTDRLPSIQRSPEIDSSRAYFYFGQAFEKLGMLDGELSLMRANLLSYSVEIADKFLAELREALDPPDVEQILSIARKYSEDFRPLTFRGLKKEVDLACEILRQEHAGSDAGVNNPQAVSPAPATNEPPTKRTNTAAGDAADKILSALCKHHKYYERGHGVLSCEYWEPCGINELARLANVSSGSVTNFFKRKLKVGVNEQAHHAYNRICHDGSLPTMLQLWRGEYPTKNLQLLRQNRNDNDDDDDN